jgi:hypothetical protein
MFQSFLEYSKSTAIKKKLIDQYGKIKVYVVNGNAVRNSSKASEEFGGSSTHANLPTTVPENEIWIEDDVKPEERPILIHSDLYQIRMMMHGMSLGKAYDLQIKKEKDYRESISLSKKHPLSTNKPADPSIYLKKYGYIKSGSINVWIVSGEKVRNRYKTDWIEGGNPAVYGFNPNDEIWLEFGIHEEEFPCILLHEYVEMNIMMYRGLDYNHAHEIAAKVEWQMRCDDTKYSKSDVLSLTKVKALEMAEKYLPKNKT